MSVNGRQDVKFSSLLADGDVEDEGEDRESEGSKEGANGVSDEAQRGGGGEEDGEGISLLSAEQRKHQGRWNSLSLCAIGVALAMGVLLGFFANSAQLLSLPAPLPSVVQSGMTSCDCSLSSLSSSSSSACPSVCVFYYFAPLWHATPENSRAHGFGHTDWDLLRAVLDQQPHLRTMADKDIFNAQWMQQPGELGYYNQLNVQTRKRQGELVQQYGGQGFIYHIFWFETYPLFEEFFRLVLLDGQPAVPFFFNWASEDWRIIGEFQFHMCETADSNRRAFWHWLSPFMRDPRYVRVHNRPILSFYQWRNSPACDGLVRDLRRYAWEDREVNGFDDLFISRVLAHFHLGDESAMLTAVNQTYDGVMEFMPNVVRSWPSRAHALTVVARPRMHQVHWRGTPANWDNRPRGAWGAATGRWELHPYEFEMHLREVYHHTVANLHPAGMPNVLTINAWNEWSEGAVMEPSRQLQRRMLEKVQRTLWPDYAGVFSVFLPTSLAEVDDGRLREQVAAALTALDGALKSAPPGPVSAWGERSLMFDYELLVFLSDSPADLPKTKPIRALLLSFHHPRLRFVDLPFPTEANGTAVAPAKLPITQSTMRLLLDLSRSVQTPDWFLVLTGVTEPTALQPLATLAEAARGQLQSINPVVTHFALKQTEFTAFRMDHAESRWPEFAAQAGSLISD